MYLKHGIGEQVIKQTIEAQIEKEINDYLVTVIKKKEKQHE